MDDQIKTTTRTEKQMLKVKLLKQGAEGVSLQFSETHFVTKTNEANEVVSEDKNVVIHTVEGDFQPHKDFMDAMKMLRKHVIGICELGNYDKFDQIRINGITLSGMEDNDEAGVVISATKELGNGTAWNFVTPFTQLADNPKYADSAQLDEFCNAICREAWAYKDGKHAENPQLTLQFENGEKESLEVQEEEEQEN